MYIRKLLRCDHCGRTTLQSQRQGDLTTGLLLTARLLGTKQTGVLNMATCWVRVLRLDGVVAIMGLLLLL